VLQVGQEVTVKVLKFDHEKERISLGLKQVVPDPWETMATATGEHARGGPRGERHRLRRFSRARAGVEG
jgi:small subunit ribosomal protein S1